ncbi:hypothetical protein KEM56_004916 [Ascosphaera pollenicola]|nr:hypothetical protein KEM56_004916 [Ascosphaera pollenicola]
MMKSHFYIRRYQTWNSSVFPCPRVERLEIAPLNVENIDLIGVTSSNGITGECREDTHCFGHLVRGEDDRILPPSFCLVDDLEIKDERTYACQRYVRLESGHSEFSEEIRQSLRVGDSSVQAVRVKMWDNLTIGVHPEMCSPLNLDFDGDEVHVMIVTEETSKEEITFDDGPSLLKETILFPENEETPDDFMVGTTLSFSELSKFDYKNPLAKMSKAKDASRESIVKLPERIRGNTINDFFSNWESSVSNINSAIGIAKRPFMELYVCPFSSEIRLSPEEAGNLTSNISLFNSATLAYDTPKGMSTQLEDIAGASKTTRTLRPESHSARLRL